MYYTIIITSNKIQRDICQVHIHLHEYGRLIYPESALMFEKIKPLIATIDRNNAKYNTLLTMDWYFQPIVIERPVEKDFTC